MNRKHFGKNLNSSNKVLTVLVCILAVVCLVAGGIYIDTFHGQGRFLALIGKTNQKQTQEEETTVSTDTPKESMAVDVSSKASVAAFGKEFLLCTKDGVKYYASMGEQKWSDTFSMTSPTLVQEGSFVAVGDMGGKSVRVYNKEGMVYDLQAEGSPVQFALNENGYLSLITKNDSSYRICVYNQKGKLLKERVEESKGIYPLSSDVSDDSKVFAVSYLDTTDISPVGRVLLFYINAEDGENFTDSMFAAVEKTDEIIPVISYRKNGTLAVISDQAVYGVGSDGGELWNYPLENTIDQAALGNKDYIVLALGDGVANKDGREKGTVCWLDGSGNEKGSFASGESVTYLLAAEKGIVVGNDRDFTGVSYSGNESWNYTAITDLNDLIPMEKLNRVMTVGKDEIAVYAMTKGKKQTNAAKAADAAEQTAADTNSTDSTTKNSTTKKTAETQQNTENTENTGTSAKNEATQNETTNEATQNQETQNQ